MDELIKVLTSYGALGVVFALIILGFLVPRRSYDDMKADRDAWREAAQTEGEAHAATRAALIESNRQLQVAVETAKTANAMLDRLGHLRGPQ